MNKVELMEKYKDEKVLCISNFHLDSWLKAKKDSVKALLKGIICHGYFDYRYNAEIDYNAKQVIPYVVLKHKDKYFVTTRKKGDSRLVGGSSIAVGGHVNPCDVPVLSRLSEPLTVIENCISRELSEETTVEPNMIKSKKYVSTFIDESSDVSKVHVCLLTVIELNTDEIEIKETDKLVGAWLDADEIHAKLDSFEGWSKITIDLLGIKPTPVKKVAKKKVVKEATDVE